MDILIIIIKVIVLSLTAIGNLVIFFFKTVFELLLKTYLYLKSTLIKSEKEIKSYRKSKLKKIRYNFEIFKFKSRLFWKRITRKFNSQKRKKRIQKIKTLPQNEITIYPVPKHIVIKFKYFVLGFIFCFLIAFIPFGAYVFVHSLPNPSQLSEREIPQTTKIFDRNGILLYQIFANENRTLVPLGSIPNNFINATIAIEDKDFYKNPGFDINAMIRATIANFSGKSIQGGSTITQQLIKSTLLTPEKTIQRKIRELALAFWAEKIYTKNQILEMYFNQVPYGGTAWGVEAASETYFNKNVKDLDLAESAFLAGMPQAPTTYSPYGQNPDLWRQRQKEVLQKMLNLKYITKEDEESALNENLTFQPPQTPIYAPHFVMYVKEYLIKKYGLPMVEKGGLNVITTLDLKLQNKIQDIVTQEVNQDAYLNLTNGAALVTNPQNGDILAMVGSKDYQDQNSGNVNLTTSLRQPGSSIKVVTYAAALSNGFTAATVLDDSPITYAIPGSAPYSPVNYDGAFHGRIPLRIAFANSFNIPAVKTLQKIGLKQMMDTGKNMGITTWGNPQNYGLSITLGAAEVKMTDMATVYGTVANLGKKVELDPILRLTDYAKDINYRKQIELPNQILSSGVSYIISDILADNGARSWEFGLNSPLNIAGHTVSVKTGTSDSKRDNWTIGFTPSFLTAVWVGNNDNSPMSQSLASGITGAAPIWNKIMTLLLQNSPDEKEKIPSDVLQKTCFGKMEFFVKGNDKCEFAATPSATFIRPN